MATALITSPPGYFSIENSLFKNIFGHNFCFCQPIFKICSIFYDKFSTKYCEENILPTSK